MGVGCSLRSIDNSAHAAESKPKDGIEAEADARKFEETSAVYARANAHMHEVAAAEYASYHEEAAAEYARTQEALHLKQKSDDWCGAGRYRLLSNFEGRVHLMSGTLPSNSCTFRVHIDFSTFACLSVGNRVACSIPEHDGHQHHHRKGGTISHALRSRAVRHDSYFEREQEALFGEKCEHCPIPGVHTHPWPYT